MGTDYLTSICHNLYIECGRYETPVVPRDRRWCIHCLQNLTSKTVEDVLHVLVDCPLYDPIRKNSTTSRKTKPTSPVCCLTKNYARKKLTQWPEQSMQSSLSTKAQRPFTIVLNFTLAQEPILSFKYLPFFDPPGPCPGVSEITDSPPPPGRPHFNFLRFQPKFCLLEKWK